MCACVLCGLFQCGICQILVAIQMSAFHLCSLRFSSKTRRNSIFFKFSRRARNMIYANSCCLKVSAFSLNLLSSDSRHSALSLGFNFHPVILWSFMHGFSYSNNTTFIQFFRFEYIWIFYYKLKTSGGNLEWVRWVKHWKYVVFHMIICVHIWAFEWRCSNVIPPEQQIDFHLLEYDLDHWNTWNKSRKKITA